MWSESFESMLPMMMMFMMAALLRASYELSRPSVSNSVLYLPQVQERPDDELTAWQREASKRAVKAYDGAQEKKWRHWNEAMFEPK